jgi:hypothetical protein
MTSSYPQTLGQSLVFLTLLPNTLLLVKTTNENRITLISKLGKRLLPHRVELYGHISSIAEHTDVIKCRRQNYIIYRRN